MRNECHFSFWALVLGCLLVVGTSASAAPIVTVKVRSGLCHDSSSFFEGSGFLITDGTHPLVVTSEHVVFHGNEPFCHFVGDRRARLRAVDWGKGLALLEIADTKKGEMSRYAPLSAFSSRLPGAGTPVIVAGFPFGTERLLTSSEGRVLLPVSPRHLMPGVSDVIELIDAHGEFGMSGGPVTSRDGDRIYGLLSHQYLSLELNVPSRVGEFDGPQSVVQNHLLILPATEIRAWVEKSLRDSKPTFIRDPFEQLEHRTRVYTSGLSFEAVPTVGSCVGEQSSGATGGGHSGGGDAGGTGGGDVGGTGGDPTSRTKSITVKVTLDAEGRTADWPMLQRASWRDRVVEKLYLKSTVKVTHLRFHDPATGKLRLFCFSSLDQFFRRLASDDVTPVTLMSGGVIPVDENRALMDLRGLATDIVSHVAAIVPKASSIALPYLGHVRLVADTLLSEEWFLLTPGELRKLADPASIAWREIFSTAFDEGVALLQDLRKLEESYGRVSL